MKNQMITDENFLADITNRNEADKRIISKPNEVTITSLEIAELTGKRHDHILRDIEDILGKIRDVPKFGEIYKDARNREQRCYRLPKIEALILEGQIYFCEKLRRLNIKSNEEEL